MSPQLARWPSAAKSHRPRTICSGCDYLDASAGSYLGAHDPTLQDQSTFTNTQMAPGAFSDMWVFDLNPAGEATINAIFNPFGAVSDFTVSLYADDGLGLRGGCARGMQRH